jgi:hypothetical protein
MLECSVIDASLPISGFAERAHPDSLRSASFAQGCSVTLTRGSMSALKLASMAAVFGAVVGSTACKGGRSGDSTARSVDTSVTTTKVRDTTVVKADTTVHVDTTKQTHHVPDAKKP